VPLKVSRGVRGAVSCGCYFNPRHVLSRAALTPGDLLTAVAPTTACATVRLDSLKIVAALPVQSLVSATSSHRRHACGIGVTCFVIENLQHFVP
jgi:hypothetical protein